MQAIISTFHTAWRPHTVKERNLEGEGVVKLARVLVFVVAANQTWTLHLQNTATFFQGPGFSSKPAGPQTPKA